MKAAFDWVYKELGTVLSVLKDGSGKFSSKRVIAVALILDVLLTGQLAQGNLLGTILAGLKVIGGFVLLVVAAITKT